MTSRRPLLSLLLAISGSGMLCASAENADEKPATLRVAGIVLKWIRADKEANYRRIEPLIREAAQHARSLWSQPSVF